jgi:hypothetical protein
MAPAKVFKGLNTKKHLEDRKMNDRKIKLRIDKRS